ncbi:MAG: hypothetical protein M1825_004408 [Sarcosagium campestre]|nr:MAG: hypothetical protein M1825_004408 [Sarcosagium campestre]
MASGSGANMDLVSALEFVEERKRRSRYLLLLNIVQVMNSTHFRSPGLLDERRMDHAMRAGKQLLRSSRTQIEARFDLGTSIEAWIGLNDTMDAAITSLEQQALAASNPVAAVYHGASVATGSHIFLKLHKDLERINDLTMISRNMLAAASIAQDLCAEVKFEQQILKLIDVCVRVAGRGYDGEAGTRSEVKWQRVVEAFKKLLTICLQFLHNLVANNERRKLLLWMDLFASSSCSDPSALRRVDPAAYLSEVRMPARKEDLNSGDESTHTDGSRSEAASSGTKNPADVSSSNSTIDHASTALSLLEENHISGMDRGAKTHNKKHAETISSTSNDGDSSKLRGNGGKAQESGASSPENAPSSANIPQDRITSDSTPRQATICSGRNDEVGVHLSGGLIISPALVDYNWKGLQWGPIEDHRNDRKVMCTPETGADNLVITKKQVGERHYDSVDEADTVGIEAEKDLDKADARENLPDKVGEELSAAAADENDGYEFWDHERGLLTDVPLVLGQFEIEPLAMLIQAGIVDGFGSKVPDGVDEDMQAVRCHVMVSQESGRALLKELFIFIAVWDLPEERLFFKIMMQIMDTLLINGLMPYVYLALSETKDIISPAQAVIIKLLTQIFRARQNDKAADELGASNTTAGGPVSLRSRFNVLAIRSIFANFRLSVVPEASALMHLQGNIHRGLDTDDDFPLNLWDMERVYEGVYQYLEFFAVLNETDEWKKLLIEWDLAYELITLLKELDDGIPNGQLGAHDESSTASSSAGSPAPVSVERPFEPNPPSPPPTPTTSPTFPWRNLKKLSILVLSSLTWGSSTVQNQIRKHGGIEAILSCTHPDSHNPFITQHALLCLQFVLEGNRANQDVVGELTPRKTVPNGVLERAGYESTLDEKGKVRLKKKQKKKKNDPAAAAAKSGKGKASNK